MQVRLFATLFSSSLFISVLGLSLRQIAYYSAYKPQPDMQPEQVIEQILTTSRHNNAECNVTGFLMFKKDVLLQYIEGEEGTIERLMLNILKDHRHHLVTIIHSKIIKTRSFPTWRMYYTVPSFDLPSIPYLDLDLLDEEDEPNAQRGL